MKAVKLAAAIGVKHVITAEGEPKTPFGKGLTHQEAIFSVVEKLHEPLRLAEDLGVKILLEPHGHLTDSIDSMNELIERCHSAALGVNLDTGNLWLGGGDSLEYIKQFGHLIGHVHWKDLSAEFIPQRGKIFGCGMSVTPLGKGVCNIKAAYAALQAIGFDGYTTLEIAGEAAVLESYRFLKELGAE
jgi:inosose dehydratase